MIQIYETETVLNKMFRSKVRFTFFLFFFALSMAITRLRAEIGFPDHDAHFCGPVQMITSGVGTTNLTATTKAVMPLFWFISRRFDNHIVVRGVRGSETSSADSIRHKAPGLMRGALSN